MKPRYKKFLYLLVAVAVVTGTAVADEKESVFEWNTVFNNNDLIPGAEPRTFNSYNPPSVNTKGMVVVRARSRGGQGMGPATHGIYMRDMGQADSEIVRVLDRTTLVPDPNNLGTTFVETPSFPRIDMHTNTIATRGNHQPVYRYYLDDEIETRAGTTGIYSNPYGGELVTGGAKLGHVPGFDFFGVPDKPGVLFEVFPGAPSITNGNVIAFKGNFSLDDTENTGVYFRHVLPEFAGGSHPAFLIANTETLIPGSHTFFGSTAPPNAADHKVVFAGFDNEWAPTLGGIYMAPLAPMPRLRTLVSIGERVPGDTTKARFNALGEGIAFDGRYVGFWGAWGDETRTLKLYCPQEGNKDRIAYCNQALICEDAVEPIGDDDSICDDESDPNFGISCYQEREVPVDQGIFVHDTRTKRTHLLARTGDDFDDFLFWNYAGKAPCTGGGHHGGGEEGGEEDGESVRWRSSAYLAVSSGIRATFRSAFKARTADVVGVYLKEGPGRSPFLTVADTTMNGQLLDPEAPVDSTIIEVGIEREGLRGDWLAINAKMGVEGGEEEDDMAGIYITELDPRTCCRAPAAN
jgi:hypothetical protein